MSVNVGELMSDPDFVELVTRRRPTGAFGARGEFASSYTDEEILASVQPADAKALELVPEGERGGGAMISLWSASEMRATDGKSYNGDLIILADGRTYRVVGEENWANNGYYFAIAEELVLA